MNKLFFSVIIFILFAVYGHSQEYIDLNKAITEALQRDPNLSSIQNTLTIQRLNINAARGELFPTLSLSADWSRNNYYTRGTTQIVNGFPIETRDQNLWQNNTRLGINSDVVLFNGFANYQNVELERQNETSVRLQYSKVKNDVVINIYQKFFDAVKKDKIVKTNEDNLQNSRDQLQKIQEYVNVGKKTLSDVYKQDVLVAQNELQLEQSKNDFSKAKIDLLYAMYIDVNKNVSVDSRNINAELTVPQLKAILDSNSNVDMLVRNAVEGRYDYKTALQYIKIDQTRLSLAVKSLYFPTISAFGSYGLNGNDFTNLTDSRTFSFGLSLSYYIFQGNRFEINRQIAEVNIKQKNEDLTRLEKEIRTDISKAVIDLETAYKQIEILDRNIKSAEQDLLLSQENFRIGFGTLLDVQTASINLNNLYISRINSIYNFLFAKKEIDYLSGKFNY